MPYKDPKRKKEYQKQYQKEYHMNHSGLFVELRQFRVFWKYTECYLEEKKCRVIWQKNNKFKLKEYKKTYYRKHNGFKLFWRLIEHPPLTSKEKLQREKERRRRQNQSLHSKKIKKEYAKQPHVIKRIKEWRLKRKMIVLNHYSNYDIKCNCCGEKEIDFLTFDHINNDGWKFRKQIRKELYQYLIKNNFPDGYQILCMNCNFAKGKDPEHLCPHQKEQAKLILNK